MTAARAHAVRRAEAGDLEALVASTRAKAVGALEVRLYVHQDNERAIAAYRRCGFADAPYRWMRKQWS